ncbi:MAG: class I SAM-dependent methyltransferase [Bacteroidota bacterium]
MKTTHEEAVSQYYDNNTRFFLKRGAHAQTFNIHQMLWAPEVRTKLEAIQYSNHLIAQQAQQINAKQLLDLGCGIGSSIHYLAKALPHSYLQGITISQEQATLGTSQLQKYQLSNRCTITQGSFQALPSSISSIDLAYAIESFVHSPDAGTFFEQVSSCLSANGTLVLIDDFLGPHALQQKPLVQRFEQGWLLGSLLSVEDVEALADSVGLELSSNTQLTHWLPLKRWRDHFIRLYINMLDRFQRHDLYFKSLRGGDARWQGLRTGVFEYRMLMFQKK